MTKQSTNFIDEKGRHIIVPTVVWIDQYGIETSVPNPKSPPVRYVQLIEVGEISHRHTMGVGGRAQGYYLKPKLEDIALIKKYKLDLGDQYYDMY